MIAYSTISLKTALDMGLLWRQGAANPIPSGAAALLLSPEWDGRTPLTHQAPAGQTSNAHVRGQRSLRRKKKKFKNSRIQHF